MVTLRDAQNLDTAAQLSYINMKPYYEHYKVDWDKSKILQMTETLENFDVIHQEQVVGFLRLSFDEQGCQLRDLQIYSEMQNKGLGSAVLEACYSLAQARGARSVWLKVFQKSPAFRLYKRHGFEIHKEDDRLYYMKRALMPV